MDLRLGPTSIHLVLALFIVSVPLLYRAEMLKAVFKVVVLTATSVVTVPYMIAFVAHMLYGWPHGPNKYKRAFAPRKVLALNYSVFQHFEYLRFARVFFSARKFYRDAMVMRLLKDIPFGSHNNTLDLYFPHQTPESMKRTLPQPVVVFIYGGAWGSGDKSTYGLLGAQVADNLNAIVCIPNYSLFPRGYVDDMVQDVVDSLTWVHRNIDKYGGDKECIILLGHSAGAHLAVMAMIELTLKRLMHNPQAIIRPDGDVTPPPAALTESFQFGKSGGSTPLSLSYRGQQLGGSATESIKFEERYFDGNSQSDSDTGSVNVIMTPPKLPGAVGPESASATGSFFFVSESEKERQLSSNGDSESFFLVKSGDNGGNGNGSGSTNSETASEPPQNFEASRDTSQDGNGHDPAESELEEEQESGAEDVPLLQAGIETPGEEIHPKLVGALESTVETLHAETADPEVPPPRARTPVELIIEDDDTMTRSQRSVRDLLQSIRCLIGLAGVYDIVDHFEHETMRGVEDLSSMGKAMYGPEHFHRFSPTQILATLPHRTRFPPVLLVHGDADVVVPLSSTEKFATAVADMGSQVIEYHVPGCQHVDICFDLMVRDRRYHELLMGVLRQAALTYTK